MRKYTLLSLVALSSLLLTSDASAQNISTYAGTGGTGYFGDGGPATAAEFFVPENLTTDDSGNVYVADLINNRIRKVSAITGIISTLAGNGAAGHSGDGGTAIAAEIDEPTGVAVDTAFNIYIADYQSNLVRKITHSTGIISTIAGTGTLGYNGDLIQATNAELANDEDVSTDDSGNVYIADTYNYRIRKITVKTGIITTIGGNGTNNYSGDGGQATVAELGHTESLKSDGAGNVYFSDENNNRVRYIDNSTGIMTTVCGNGIGGYSGEGGPATAAEIYGPEGIGMDVAGNFYFVDIDNNRALMVNKSSGIMTLIAGNGANGFFGDGGLATAAKLSAPTGISIDKSGNIFIADQGNERIREINSLTTGIPLVYTSNEVTVYPIPNSGKMTVQLPGSGYKLLKIYDALGREIYTQLLDVAQENRAINVNLGTVSNGIYIMQLGTQTGTIGKRIVITR